MKKLILFLLIALPYTLQADEIQDYKVALSFYQDQYYDLAEEAFLEIINNYPNSLYYLKCHYYLGLSQLRQQKYNEAIDNLLYLTKVKAWDQKTSLNYYLTLCYFFTSQYQSSENYLDKKIGRAHV